MAARLQGRRIAAIKRYGKFIVVTLGGGGYLLVHLGMTGRLLLGGDVGQAHPRRLHASTAARCCTTTAASSAASSSARSSPSAWPALGPEPLEVPFEAFAAALQRRKTRIKALLLNQTFLRGIGNIYADEVALPRRIHPLAMASRLRGERARGCTTPSWRC